jgi:ketosteroid isomerase-like protein
MEQLDQTFNEGNLDAYMAPYADNAVFAPPNVPFWIEGKAALRAYYAGTMQAFPTRRVVARQPRIQIYDGGSAVVSRYNHGMFIDKNGHVTNFYLRQSYTWVKLGEHWAIIEQHYSTLPVLP